MKEQLETGFGRLSLLFSPECLFFTGMVSGQSPPWWGTHNYPPLRFLRRPLQLQLSWLHGWLGPQLPLGQAVRFHLCFSRDSATGCCCRLTMRFFWCFPQDCRTCELRAAQIGFHDWPSARGEKVQESVWMESSEAPVVFLCLINMHYVEILAFARK